MRLERSRPLTVRERGGWSVAVAAVTKRGGGATLIGRVGGERHAGGLRSGLRWREQARIRRGARILDELVCAVVRSRLHGGRRRARRRRVGQLAFRFEFGSFGAASSFTIGRTIVCLLRKGRVDAEETRRTRCAGAKRVGPGRVIDLADLCLGRLRFRERSRCNETAGEVAQNTTWQGRLEAVAEGLAVLGLVGLLNREKTRPIPMGTDESDRGSRSAKGRWLRKRATHRQTSSSRRPPLSASIAFSSNFASLHTPTPAPAAFPSPTFLAFSTAWRKSFCSVPDGMHCLIALVRVEWPAVDLRYSMTRACMCVGERARRIFELHILVVSNASVQRRIASVHDLDIAASTKRNLELIEVLLQQSRLALLALLLADRARRRTRFALVTLLIPVAVLPSPTQRNLPGSPQADVGGEG